MTTTKIAKSSSASAQKSVAAMRVGLGLTIFGMLYLAFDQAVLHTLSDNLREIYTNYAKPGEDPGSTTFVAGVLYVLGVLGVLSWLLVMRATRQGKGWVKLGGLTLFVLGLVVAAGEFVVGEYGQALVPASMAAIHTLPCIAGLVAVVHLFRKN